MECPVLGEREKERQKETERDRERERRETRSGVILCAGRFDEGYIYARDQGFYNYRVQPAWGIGGGWTLVEVVRSNLSNSSPSSYCIMWHQCSLSGIPKYLPQ